MFLGILGVFCLVACQKAPDPVAGLWQAEIENGNAPKVAFQIEVVRDGDTVRGALVNGPDREEATSGSFDGKSLALKFNFYDAELQAELADGKLTGEFIRQRGKSRTGRKFTASRELPTFAATAAGPDLSGDWILKVGEGDEQRVWRATLKQEGEKLGGTVIPISGDWGNLAGYVKDGQIYLSRFDGIRGLLWTARIADDGTLVGNFGSDRKVVAERFESAMAQGTKPQDPGSYTTVKDPEEPFRFAGVDLDGKQVASTDSRFAGKVVVVTITGTWCPNCHDEAPVLVDLYKRYKDQGLEIVGLAYEYTGNVERDLELLRIYRTRHSIEFPLLLAGTTEPGEIARTLPQLVNFGAYPTTIYLNRDGKVDYIHAGFESKVTGDRHAKLVAEIEERVKHLLATPKS
ncbi:MAG: TlpA family protein disulfide reductase [Bryobacterales bacterium]|nr:TlpA family protein disulfide reductase [Bryobacterales bacterium]